MSPFPSLVTEVAHRCRSAGGRAWLVGGGVRDHLLGREVHDWDLEVYGIPEPALERLLAKIGPVNAVGRSFGVYKIRKGTTELDVSLPRRDSKVGPGHRGIGVAGDPFMEPKEATRRRDLTINAILWDPLTSEYVDPWNGKVDIERKILKAVDSKTFLEDPLRALRVIQFTARLDFDVHPSLSALCAEAALHELPAERILGEWSKLLLLGVRPSRGIQLAVETGIWRTLFPDWEADPRALCDPLDRFATEVRKEVSPEGRQLALALVVLMHGQSQFSIERALTRLGIHRWAGFPCRDKVLTALKAWNIPLNTDTDLRRASVDAELGLLLRAKQILGQNAAPAQRAAELGVEWAAPEPLLKGRDLTGWGVPPGKAMGQLLGLVYAMQLEGAVASPAEAQTAAQRLLQEAAG